MDEASPDLPGGLLLEQIQVGPMENFVYVVGCAETREVALVDPAWAIDDLLAHVENQGLRPTAALVTHYHPDHVGGHMMGTRIEGLGELVGERDLKVFVHRAEVPGVKKVTGLSTSDIVAVDSGHKLAIGNIEVEFLHTPGHTPGSQCFRVRNMLVAGDTLFIQGCGRVDLPGADPDQMYDSLKKLASLPDETVLLPGHDYSPPHSSALLGEVKRLNYALQAPSLQAFREMMGR